MNVTVAVVRYFGGTRLGKGGLARAYREAARRVLQEAAPVRDVERLALRISGPSERDGEVRHLIAGHGGRVTGATYGEDGRMRLQVLLPKAAHRPFRDGLDAITRGAFRVEAAVRTSD